MSQVGNLDRQLAVPEAFRVIDLYPKLDARREVGVWSRRETLLAVLLIRASIYIMGLVSLAAVSSPRQIDATVASGTPWIAFDGNAYRDILLHGYGAGPKIPYQIAYFPLFPYAARAFLPICNSVFGTREGSAAAMLLFSNICSLIGFVFFYEWARLYLSGRMASIATLLLATYPGSVFFCAGLSEGPFLMLVAVALYLLGKKQFLAAAAVSALATFSRPTGIALACTVTAWTFYQSRALPTRRQLLKVALIGALSCAGAVSYQCFLWHRYQSFNAYELAENFYWDPHLTPSEITKQAISRDAFAQKGFVEYEASIGNPTASSSADVDASIPRYSVAFFANRLLKTQGWNRVIALALLVVLIAAYIRPVPIPRTLLILPLTIFLITYVPNWGLRASSMFRYESASLPLFLVMANWLSVPSRRPLLFCICTCSMGLQLYYAFLFSRGMWVG
jgi:Gpi18-like mannosyltransferase